MGKSQTQSVQPQTVPTQTKKAVETEFTAQDLTLFKSPVKTLYYFLVVVFNFFKGILSFILKHVIIFALLLALIIVPVVVKGPHTPEVGYFMAYWIVLGVASSIGLGTGLHTFVLYLGPWIAKVALVASECRTIPRMIPNKWSFESFDDCPENVANPIGFLEILLSVQFEAFLWGFGTALGELPPYFIARAARKAQQNKNGNIISFFNRFSDDQDLKSVLKRLIYTKLQKHGFITVLLCASIPNPLFDLAGITCGHFGIPFVIFFSATAIGKAIIKTHLQMVFVIFVFSQHYVEYLLDIVEKWLPFLHGNLSQMLEKQKQLLHTPHVQEGDAPIIKVIWDYFILAMILFFLVSIIQSLAQQHYNDLTEAQSEKTSTPSSKNESKENKKANKDKKKQD